MPEAVIVDAIRTPIGRAGKGSLKDVRTDDLAAVPLKALVERNPGVDFSRDRRRDDGLRLRRWARRATTSAATRRCSPGLDHHIPATTVNRFCASSLQTIRMAFHAIKAGEGDQYIAAGVEAVSRFPAAPAVRSAPAARRRRRRAVQRLHPDGPDRRERRRALQGLARGAGRVGEALARTARWRRATRATSTPRSSRSATSHATTARARGRRWRSWPSSSRCSSPTRHGHRRQLVPAQRRRRRGAGDVRGEGGRARPKPRARIVASSRVGAPRPEIMGLGPIPAVKAVLEQAGMTIDDIDIVELNEAFAAQVVPCRDELGIDAEKLNPFGGAIALGHPFGMTGARIMTTLLNGLDTLDGTYGLETMCVAGGMGQAMIVERLN